MGLGCSFLSRQRVLIDWYVSLVSHPACLLSIIRNHFVLHLLCGSLTFLGSSDHTAILTKVATGEVVRQYTGHAKAVSAVAMHDTI